MIAFLCAAIALAFGVFRLYGSVMKMEREVGWAVGALLDGIPESIVIGVSMIGGGAVSWVTVAAVFLRTFRKGSPALLA